MCCRDGVLGKMQYNSLLADIDLAFRCLSDLDDLDAISADCSMEHTDQAIKSFSQVELGSRYGIIKQLVVSSTIW